MVERTVYGEAIFKPKCSQCGKEEGDMITVYRSGDQLSSSRFIGAYCSHECQLRSKGFNVFDGEIEALLESRLKRNKEGVRG